MAHTVYLIQCQGLGLITEVVYAEPPSEEELAKWNKKDMETHGRRPDGTMRESMFIKVVAVPLEGDPSKLTEWVPPPPPPKTNNRDAIIDLFQVEAYGTVTPTKE